VGYFATPVVVGCWVMTLTGASQRARDATDPNNREDVARMLGLKTLDGKPLTHTQQQDSANTGKS